jgi:hypothetical protein
MENKELLEKVMRNRLERSLKAGDAEREKADFREAMEATDRYIELEKVESAKKEQKENRILKIVEIAAVPVVLTGINFLCKKSFARDVMQFEKEDTFTSTPGRTGISSFFRFKD